MTDNERHIISLVGGGGKTSVMRQLAEFSAARGRHVLATTSTHLWQPQRDEEKIFAPEAYAPDMKAVRALWRRGRCALIGTPEAATGKLAPPGAKLWAAALREAELVLVEADGARGMPCKLPAAHEPVLPPESDIVVAVAGLDALGRTLMEACFRWQLGGEFLGEPERKIDARMLALLLASDWGGRKAVGVRAFYVVLNKSDLVSAESAAAVRAELLRLGIATEKIWTRGSK